MKNEPSISDADLIDLIVRYFDDQLDEYESVALSAALEGDDRALELFHTLSLQSLTVAELAAKGKKTPRPPFPRMMAWGAVLALAMSLMVAAFLFFRSADPSLAKIIEVQGHATATSPSGETRKLALGDVVTSGYHLSTKQVGSLAKLAFADQTILSLLDSTEVTLHKSEFKQVDVLAGNVIAEVSAQPPGKPMKIVTQQATTEVLGTVLSVHATDQKTDVDVLKGKVRVARTGDRKSIDVTAGESTSVSRSLPLKTKPHTIPPTHWRVDFEEGLPNDWRKGIWVNEGLPSGSRGGVRAEARPGFWDRSVNWYNVETYNHWSDGLFRISDDTEMRISMHTDRSSWIQVILLTRDENFEGGSKTYEYVASTPKKNSGSDWGVLSAPLSQFKKVKKDPNIGYRQAPIDPPPVGWVVYKVMVSTQQYDLGVVIDDIEFGPRIDKDEKEPTM